MFGFPQGVKRTVSHPDWILICIIIFSQHIITQPSKQKQDLEPPNPWSVMFLSSLTVFAALRSETTFEYDN